MSVHSAALAAIASRNSATAGIRRAFMLMAAAMFIADGKLSLEDCDILT
jgi:hypothetical protein